MFPGFEVGVCLSSLPPSTPIYQQAGRSAFWASCWTCCHSPSCQEPHLTHSYPSDLPPCGSLPQRTLSPVLQASGLITPVTALALTVPFHGSCNLLDKDAVLIMRDPGPLPAFL